MRSSRAATSRNGRPGASSVSLFPFLAVLICTMGALILLLVVIARHARVQAAKAAQAVQAAQATAVDYSAEEEELKADRELVRWRIEQIEASRAAARKELADSRLRLGQIEDHARQLADQITKLEATYAELNSQGQKDAAQTEAMKRELDERRRQLAEAEKELAAARQKAAEEKRSYAIVPYEGTHGTRRQPIYIECRADAIVMQPEGIVMTGEDFNGPLGPGNPLDVALRARREYLLNRGRLDPDMAGEPYPLLLVRPRGTMAYYVAREAMKTWDTEFGYELIGEDWKLAFPPSDPQMAAEIARAVDVARLRQRRLAAAVPRYSTAEARPKYRAAPYLGGAVRDGGGGGGDDRYGSGSGRHAGAGGFGGTGSGGASSAGGGGDRYPAPGGFGDGSGSGGATVSPGDGISGSGGMPSPGQGGGSFAAGGSAPTSGSVGDRYAAASSAGQATASDDRNGSPGDPASAGSSGGRFGDAGGPAAKVAASTEGAVAGRPPREETLPPGAAGAAPRPGEWIPQDERGSAAGGPSCSTQNGSVRPLAEQRGRDWGLPDATQGSVPITRPIRVDCYADRLVIVPERGLSAVKAVPLGASTGDSVDSFISSVWQVIESWGIAGRGMYWRPVLNVRVAPDGDRRFNDLQTLLDGSGLDVNRKDGP